MKPGFVESAPLKEVTTRKDFWNDQLRRIGKDNKYHAVARQVPGISHGAGVYLGIFIEEKPTGDD